MIAVGALAPTVFLPRPEIIHISVPFFSAPPRSCTFILAPMLFSPVWRQCLYYSLLNMTLTIVGICLRSPSLENCKLSNQIHFNLFQYSYYMGNFFYCRM